MLKNIVYCLVALSIASNALAANKMTYEEIKSKVQFWETDADKNFVKSPVYYGHIWSGPTKRTQFCLVLSFMNFDDNKKQISYAHKIWIPKPGEKCKYENTEELVVGNGYRSACLNDTSLDLSSNQTNRELTPNNISYFSPTSPDKENVYRELNFNKYEVTQYTDCDHKPLSGQRVDQMAKIFANDKTFTMVTDVGYTYEVNIIPVDTAVDNPPSEDEEELYNSL